MQVEQQRLELLQLHERIQILEKEQVELINIPVPDFSHGDPARIVHDFQRVSGRTCRRSCQQSRGGAECVCVCVLRS